VGVPTAYYLAFGRSWGLAGLWGGIACVNTLQGAVMLALPLRFDFEGEARRAKERNWVLLEPLLEEQDGGGGPGGPGGEV
jgi:hypothetical protein